VPRVEGYYKRTKDGRRVYVKPHFRKPPAKTFSRLKEQLGRNPIELDDTSIRRAIDIRDKELSSLRWKKTGILQDLMKFDEEIPKATWRRQQYILVKADDLSKKLTVLKKKIPLLEDEIEVLRNIRFDRN